MKKNQVVRPLNNVSTFNAQVDLIVPYHGQYAKVTDLLESIFRLTRSNYYTVCLVDDCSPNLLYLESVQKNIVKSGRGRATFRAIRCEEQKGFAGACKMGYDATESPYVCFINSDCLIEDANWLRSLGESLLKLKSEDVRMVSAMTNNSVGGDPSQQGEKDFRTKDDVILPDNSYLSLFCFLCHRELFPRCGGFLKPYPLCGYEDQEFAARMRHHGFKQAVCRSSWVYHEGEATLKNLLRNNPDNVAQMEKNQQRCIEDMRKLL